MLTFWSPRVAWPPLTPSYSACPEGVRALCCAGSWQPPPSPPCSPFPPKAWQGPCAAAAPGGGCTGKSSWCHSWLCWSSWPAGSCSSSPRHFSPGGSWGCLMPQAGLPPSVPASPWSCIRPPLAAANIWVAMYDRFQRYKIHLLNVNKMALPVLRDKHLSLGEMSSSCV